MFRNVTLICTEMLSLHMSGGNLYLYMEVTKVLLCGDNPYFYRKVTLTYIER